MRSAAKFAVTVVWTRAALAILMGDLAHQRDEPQTVAGAAHRCTDGAYLIQ
jgi:hypothetical protein